MVLWSVFPPLNTSCISGSHEKNIINTVSASIIIISSSFCTIQLKPSLISILCFFAHLIKDNSEVGSLANHLVDLKALNILVLILVMSQRYYEMYIYIFSCNFCVNLKVQHYCPFRAACFKTIHMFFVLIPHQAHQRFPWEHCCLLRRQQFVICAIYICVRYRCSAQAPAVMIDVGSIRLALMRNTGR